MPNGAPEIFGSIQGEGATVGLPSVFLRLATCNLRCSWCDTAYTWDWERYDARVEIIDLHPAEVATLAISTASSESHQIGNLVVTGGEPLLQQAALVDVIGPVKAAGLRVEVETNGTLEPCSALGAWVDQWNVSPKLSSSGNDALVENAAALRWFSGTPSAYFKFVVTAPGDVDEAAELAARYGVPAERIILMPEGTTELALRERSQWLTGLCVQRGFRFSPRLHILVWGDVRGR